MEVVVVRYWQWKCPFHHLQVHNVRQGICRLQLLFGCLFMGFVVRPRSGPRTSIRVFYENVLVSYVAIDAACVRVVKYICADEMSSHGACWAYVCTYIHTRMRMAFCSDQRLANYHHLGPGDTRHTAYWPAEIVEFFIGSIHSSRTYIFGPFELSCLAETTQAYIIDLIIQ